MKERIVRTLMVKFRFAQFKGCRFPQIFIGLAAVIAAVSFFHGGVAHAGAEYSWTKTMGGTGSDVSRAVVMDGSGNVYATGHFADTVNFDPDGAGDSHTSPHEDMFLTRINFDGSYGWTKTSMGDAHGESVAVDGSGDIYVTGSFGNTTDFDPGGAGDSHTSAGFNDIFLTKISSTGAYGWTKIMGGTDDDLGISVTVDVNGNVYMAGYFSGTVNFADDWAGTDNHTSARTLDVFLTRINSDGSYGWTKTMGGSDDDADVNVAVDVSGNVYVMGYFTGTAEFNPDGSSDIHMSADLGDIFLTKISSAGAYGWTKIMGGTGDDGGMSSVAVDGSGNVYVTAYFTNTVNFAADWAGTDGHTSSGLWDAFLTRIDSDGSYGWTKSIGGTGNDVGISVTVDDNDRIYVTGAFSETVDFDPGVGTDSHTSSGSFDIFLMRINPDGSYGWTETMGGSSMDAGMSVAADSSGNVYITGLFNGTADFDPGVGMDSHTSVGGEDIFFSNFNVPGFAINPRSAVTGEDGTQATFKVRLNTAPSFNVTIGVSSSDTGEGTVDKTSLTFTNLNWDANQMVTVTGVDDDIADGNQSYSIVLGTITSPDAWGYYGIDPPDVSVINTDIGETAGFTVSAISGDTGEDGTQATFTVKLTSEPIGDVVIDVASSDTSEGTVDKTSLTFTNLNWDANQIVTVTGVDDDIADGNQSYSIQLTVNAAGTTDTTGYASLNPPDVSVINTDIGETAGFTVSAISGDTGEDGTQATFTVKLTSEPIGNVVIDVASSDTSEGTVDKTSLTFTPADWNANQVVTVTGVDDPVTDGNQDYTIVLAAATSSDSEYSGLNPSDVAVINVDDDDAGGDGGGAGCFIATTPR